MTKSTNITVFRTEANIRHAHIIYDADANRTFDNPEWPTTLT